MTDTPPLGAADAARVHGDSAAMAAITVTKLAQPRPLSADEADAAFQPRTMGPVDASTVVVPVSTLVPNLTALVRWSMQGAGVWLVSHGMSQGREAALEPIATGLALSAGALAWSWLQKRLQKLRLMRAARAHPSSVVFR